MKTTPAPSGSTRLGHYLLTQLPPLLLTQPPPPRLTQLPPPPPPRFTQLPPPPAPLTQPPRRLIQPARASGAARWPRMAPPMTAADHFRSPLRKSLRPVNLSSRAGSSRGSDSASSALNSPPVLSGIADQPPSLRLGGLLGRRRK